jgi:hypothetical protein
MQVLNRLKPQNIPLFAIQALCAAGPWKVVSRTEIFQFITQGSYSRYSRHFLSTLACFKAGEERDIVQ